LNTISINLVLKTNSMNYIGSKKSLLDFLYNSIISVVKKDNYIFSDLFA